MGMCYTVNLTLKYKESHEETVKVFMRNATDTYVPGVPEDATIVEMIRMIFFDIKGKRTTVDGIVTLEGHADFDASYGWDSVMSEWFESLAPMLQDGSELEDFPDNGYEKLYLKDGKLYRVIMEYACWHRILFSYNGIMYGFDIADATIDDPEDLENNPELQKELVQQYGKNHWRKIGSVDNTKDEIKLFGCYSVDEPENTFEYVAVEEKGEVA